MTKSKPTQCEGCADGGCKRGECGGKDLNKCSSDNCETCETCLFWTQDTVPHSLVTAEIGLCTRFAARTWQHKTNECCCWIGKTEKTEKTEKTDFTKNASGLYPCIFCGSVAVELTPEPASNSDYVWVRCRNCLANEKIYDNTPEQKQECIDLHNYLSKALYREGY